MPTSSHSPDVPLHAPPPDINEWHQQAYDVPFMSVEDAEVEEEFFDDRDQFAPPPHQGDPGPSSSYHPPRIHQVALLLLLTPGRKTLMSIWLLASLILLHLGDFWLFLLLFFGARCQKGGEVLLVSCWIGSPRG